MSPTTSLSREKGGTTCYLMRGTKIVAVGGVIVGAAVVTFYVIRVWRRSGRPEAKVKTEQKTERFSAPSPLESVNNEHAEAIEVPRNKMIGDGDAPALRPPEVADIEGGEDGALSRMETASDAKHHEAATILQSAWRGRSTTKHRAEKNTSFAVLRPFLVPQESRTDQQAQEEKKMLAAAITLQSAWRRTMAKENAMAKKRGAAVHVLQSAWRRVAPSVKNARSRAAALKYEEQQRLARVEIAQQYVRECSARANVRVSRGERALICLQACFRGMLLRRKLARAECAVVILQAHARGNITRFTAAEDAWAARASRHSYACDALTRGSDSEGDGDGVHTKLPVTAPPRASHGTLYTTVNRGAEIEVDRLHDFGRCREIHSRDISNLPINNRDFVNIISATDKPHIEERERSDQWKALVSTLDKIAKVNGILPGRGDLSASNRDAEEKEFFLVEGNPSWEANLPPEGMAEGWTVHAPFACGEMIIATEQGVSFGDDAREIAENIARIEDTRSMDRTLKKSEISAEDLMARRAKIEQAIASARAQAPIESEVEKTHEQHHALQQQQQEEHEAQQEASTKPRKIKKKNKDKRKRLVAKQKKAKKNAYLLEVSRSCGEEGNAAGVRAATAVAR